MQLLRHVANWVGLCLLFLGQAIRLARVLLEPASCELHLCLLLRFICVFFSQCRLKMFAARPHSVSSLQVSSLVFFGGVRRESAGALAMKW